MCGRTIFFDYFFSKHASYILEKNSDFWYNENMSYCRHVYENVGEEICPDCGKDTHETDFALTNKLHRQHIADGKDQPYKCSDCGGTIRGWWDI